MNTVHSKMSSDAYISMFAEFLQIVYKRIYMCYTAHVDIIF